MFVSKKKLCKCASAPMLFFISINYSLTLNNRILHVWYNLFVITKMKRTTCLKVHTIKMLIIVCRFLIAFVTMTQSAIVDSAAGIALPLAIVIIIIVIVVTIVIVLFVIIIFSRKQQKTTFTVYNIY